ncbi:NAD(P)-dependent oxidoreductase, partial [Huaxiibacter chinensis]|uniref:NAD(P)-dependent oxidoreductase n=1 Tax=Huaxiibacter chinensis TaxID=2899785 RepID=UPI003D30F072
MPLFAALKDRPVLVVGTGEIAERKMLFLRRAGAQVKVVEEAQFEESLLDSIVLVIAATTNRELNRRISDAANARFRLVNVVDDQPLCSFIFPSIVDRSPLIVAISSGGTAPVLARVLREKIEALLPTSLGRMAEKASYWRNHLKTRLTSVTERRRFWERVFRGRFASLMQAGNETAAQQILEDELDNPGRSTGEIILVGAGPGDPGLLTLRGLQVLQDADVVFYDHLVTDGIRELIRRDAEQICVGKRASEHS